MVAAYVAPAVDPIMRYTADEWRQMAARSSVRSFARRMVHGYEESDHIRQLVAELEDAISTPDSRLILTLPPRHSKSLHVSENLPPFYLGRFPDNRVLAASHTQRLANTFSRRARNKIANPLYPFRDAKIAGDKAAVEAWDIAGRQGGYFAVGVGGAPAGIGANLIVIDDPIRNAEEADSETAREALWEWYREDIRTRLEPGGSIVVTATRWHADDLTGRLLAAQVTGGERWRHVNMPALDDDGNALWPQRWPREALERLKGAVGSRAWESLYQGRPSPAEGGTFKRDWWRFYRELPGDLTDHTQSWDMSFRETKSGSFVVGQVWAKGPKGHPADRYLLDQVRFRGDFPVAVQAVRALSAKWPQARAKIVEDKANGPAIVATLKHEISGLIEVSPEGGKEARASAIAPQVEAGNVYLPDPSIAPWVGDFIEECAAFPTGKNDDQVDCLSQALLRMAVKRGGAGGLS